MRTELAPLPARMQALPVDGRGYPVPWFVQWIDGVPEFRLMDRDKYVRAIRDRLCWCCGQPLGRFLTFVIGPMCAINRVSSEPPSHLECAEWSARNCPFLSRPHMVRREDARTAAATVVGGQMIPRNPGVTLLWTTRQYQVVRDGEGGTVLVLGDPTSTSWWREGRAATRAEVLASIESGLPALVELAVQDGPEALAELQAMLIAAYEQLPHETPDADAPLTLADVTARLTAAAACAPRSVDAAIAEATQAREMTCRVCGCSETDGCEGGCLWAAPSLCSRCVTADVAGGIA